MVRRPGTPGPPHIGSVFSEIPRINFSKGKTLAMGADPPPNLNPTVVLEIKCPHCGKIFRLRASLADVLRESKRT
jgi:hypothetical protein